MDITVVGPNGGKAYSSSIEDTLRSAAIVMAAKLGIAHVPIKMEISVGRTLNKACDDARGLAFATKSRNKWYADIFVMRQKRLSSMISTLAHEMIHIKQFVKDNLDIEKNKFKGRVWKARKNEDIYEDSPWEREAYDNEEALARYYLDYVKRHKC